jgi:hypothetical protein
MSEACEIANASAAEHLETVDDNQKIRDLVNKMAPTDAPVGSFEHVTNIVNLVHYSVPLQPTDQSRFPKATPYQNLLWALTDSTYGHICGGKAITVYDVLKAYGYKPQLVQGFSAPPADDGHVMIQVNGYVVDPTFNIYFVDESDNVLGAEQIFNRHHSGKPILTKYINGSSYPLTKYYQSIDLIFTQVHLIPTDKRSTPSLVNPAPGTQIFL